MATSIADLKSYCQILSSSKLLSDADLRDLVAKASSAGVTTVEGFGEWLVAKGKLTKYQAQSALRGNKTFFLDEYKLVDRIGQGRMAGVYRAQHKLGMPVAIKILPPSRSRDSQCLARFQREASLAMKMDHPRIVKTFHAGACAGLNYIAMELLEGETLDERLLRKKTLSIPETLRLAQQVLEGLQHLAERKVVHRDLKPSNLMLQTLPGQNADEGFYAVKLLDIGLGRELFDENGSANEPLTMAGATVGTPNYMAPEQSQDSHAADIRSDLYGLGCLMYECITGRVPFPEKNIVAILTKHALEMPAIPNYGPSPIAAPLHAFLWKLMAKKPRDRYQTPAEASRDLGPMLQAGTTTPLVPVAAAKPTPATPTPRPASAPTLTPQAATTFDLMPVEREAAAGNFNLILWIVGTILVLIMLATIGTYIVVQTR
jgi:serine/threonine protein kinase